MSKPAFATDLDLAYGPDPAQLLDVCAPDMQGSGKPGSARPAVLLLHGGGWQHGSRTGLERRCNAFTTRGMVAVPVDYRLADGTPPNTWPAQLQDAQLAVRWVRANAAKYGIDPHHVCVYGESAGGHLALLLGIESKIAPGDMQAILPQQSPRADCVVSVAGPTNLTTYFAARRPAIRAILGNVSPAQAEAALNAASPLLHVPADMPPVLQIQGLNDGVVPPLQATDMQAALMRQGAKSWLITHTGTHVFGAISKPEAGAVWKTIFAFIRQMGLPSQAAQTTAQALADADPKR